MIKLILNSIILLFTLNGNNQAFAQENYFTVLSTQGKIFLIKNNSRNLIEIKTGSNIYADDKLKVNNNSYIALVYSSGNSLDIYKEGIYDFDQLKNLIKNNYISSNKNFVKYVINEIMKKTEETKDMKLLGAVVRESVNFISIGVPSPTLVIDSNIVFNWYPYSNSTNYIFKLFNKNDLTIYMKELNDTAIVCLLNLFHLNKNEYYKWIVFDSNNPEVSSDTNFIMIPATHKLKAINNSINELNSLLGKDISAINQIIYASFYQDNQINIKALKAYRIAIKIAPSVLTYKKIFTDFLLKMKLNRMVEFNRIGRK